MDRSRITGMVHLSGFSMDFTGGGSIGLIYHNRDPIPWSRRNAEKWKLTLKIDNPDSDLFAFL